MTLSGTFLVLAPTLPALAAAVIAATRPDGDEAARWAVRAATVGFAAAVVVAVVVAVNGPVSAVLEAGDGHALFGLYATRVTTLLALLTTGVGLVVQSFATRNLQGDLFARRFFALASLLTAATTTVALAATLSLLCLAWIVAGLALAALVTHRATWAPARRSSRRTLRSLWVGDGALLTATVLCIASVGHIDLRSPAAAARELADSSLPVLGDHVLVVVALLLVVAGISRSALVPVHQWLPSTIAAPTPVSALLHAGVVNGAGMLLIRLAPMFGSSSAATHVAFAAGAVTACYATTVMLVRSDVKGNLAWSTAGQMGFMTVQVAIGALPAALLHIVGHGMYKASLFLAAGGSVTAHHRHHQRPAPRAVARSVRLGVALVVSAAAVAAAFVVFDPEMPTSARVLVMVFAWGTAARAISGWLHSAPFGPVPAVLAAAAGATAGVFAYIGGLTALETYVAHALPGEVADPVSTAVLVATIAVVAVVVLVVWFTPGERMRSFRGRVYANLLTSAPVASRLTTRGSSTGVAPVPESRHLQPPAELARSTRPT
ncbi:MAG TPA: proton-conducting transporter membrane subunit [Acidimicrobiales bacterium]|nr:proton-conducting transporter membrane subunit [Acidimicrobiales bacterium]